MTQIHFTRVTGLFVIFFCICLKLPAQNGTTEILWDNYGVPHIYANTNKEMYYKKQTAEYKSYIDAFVKGINDYANDHPGVIDKEMKVVLPVMGEDVFANIQRTVYRFLTASERTATEKLFQPGSNAIAIGPSRSASGHAMLIINPHLPWKPDFTLQFEANLNTPSLHAYGVTMIGMPLLFLAFNDHLGWTHTVNTLDASDRYELTLQGNGYLLDGATIPFDKNIKLIKVKQGDGTMKEEKMEIKISKHGPVMGEKDNKAWVVRIAGLENDKLFEEYHKMINAKNFSAFESALKMMQIPMFNLLYADKEGNIFYLFNGNLPKRPEGNFAYWRGTVDGTRSTLIWNETLSYDELPKVLNPPTGFLQNANEPPWNCTYPPVLDPRKFPSYVAPLFMGFRPQHAVNMIKNDSSISIDELINYTLNTGVETADRFLDDLLTAIDKYPDSTALQAAAILKAWDRKTDAASKGAVLFSTWFEKLTPAMYATRWDPFKPITTPDGLSNEKQAVSLLVQATKEVKEKYDFPDIAWGEVFRLRMNGIDLPANGGLQQEGIFMSMSYSQDTGNKFRVEGGETFIAVTEFGKTPAASVLLGYGNATQEGSKHMTDQLNLLSEKKLRQALLTKVDVLKHLEKKEILKTKL